MQACKPFTGLGPKTLPLLNVVAATTTNVHLAKEAWANLASYVDSIALSSVLALHGVAKGENALTERRI